MGADMLHSNSVDGQQVTTSWTVGRRVFSMGRLRHGVGAPSLVLLLPLLPVGGRRSRSIRILWTSDENLDRPAIVPGTEN